jgi:hypothetical protein
VKYIEQKQLKKSAALYHSNYTSVNVAKGLEISQRARGDLLEVREYDELEAASLLAVYFVHLNVTGLVKDEALQARLVERARRIAEEKLGYGLEAELTE